MYFQSLEIHIQMQATHRDFILGMCVTSGSYKII